jgi:hypothetical protein
VTRALGIPMPVRETAVTGFFMVCSSLSAARFPPVMDWQLTRGCVPQDINACVQVLCDVAAV